MGKALTPKEINRLLKDSKSCAKCGRIPMGSVNGIYFCGQLNCREYAQDIARTIAMKAKNETQVR